MIRIGIGSTRSLSGRGRTRTSGFPKIRYMVSLRRASALPKPLANGWVSSGLTAPRLRWRLIVRDRARGAQVGPDFAAPGPAGRYARWEPNSTPGQLRNCPDQTPGGINR